MRQSSTNVDNLFYHKTTIHAYTSSGRCSSHVQTSGVHLATFPGPKTCRQLIYVWIVFKMPTISHYRRFRVEWNHLRLCHGAIVATAAKLYVGNSKNDSNDFTVSCLVTKPRIHRTYSAHKSQTDYINTTRPGAAEVSTPLLLVLLFIFPILFSLLDVFFSLCFFPLAICSPLFLFLSVISFYVNVSR